MLCRGYRREMIAPTEFLGDIEENNHLHKNIRFMI
nr:MAG TPA: hypothetical protein [Caudoviricetes sp.]DAT76713.1 MAG TPA: hypothetical protein [Caudoviricetes sp.]